MYVLPATSVATLTASVTLTAVPLAVTSNSSPVNSASSAKASFNTTVTDVFVIALTDSTVTSAFSTSFNPTTAALRAAVAAFTSSTLASSPLASTASAAFLASSKSFTDSGVLPSVSASPALATASFNAFTASSKSLFSAYITKKFRHFLPYHVISPVTQQSVFCNFHLEPTPHGRLSSHTACHQFLKFIFGEINCYH